MSCPFMKNNWEKNCEVCTVTGKPTNGAVECDFGYDEECETYRKKATKNSKTKEKT